MLLLIEFFILLQVTNFNTHKNILGKLLVIQEKYSILILFKVCDYVMHNNLPNCNVGDPPI